uniref:Conserved repeat protein n=1 Tax=Eubacterium cellulosolvens (strain ATCC 43171 / JCM 9499 / 6) TaxID=633697 RepID=I5AQU9_EUBC6
MRIKMKRFLGILLSLALILGLMPGMSLTAYADDQKAYADYDVTTDDNKTKSGDALTALQVKFNEMSWYIIEDNSTAVNAGTVTMLAAESLGTSKFYDSGSSNKYSMSKIKTTLDNMTASDGSFAGVASAISTVKVKGSESDTEVDAKLYLLNIAEANNLPQNVRKLSASWWLRSPGTNGVDYAAIVGNGSGDVVGAGAYVTLEYGVRPALKLDLSKVAFVTYDANGGTGNMEPQVVYESGALSENAFEKEGYVFNGWNTAADGKGTNYGKWIDNITEDVTLYAQWVKPNVKVGAVFNAGDTMVFENQNGIWFKTDTTNKYENHGYLTIKIDSISSTSVSFSPGNLPYLNAQFSSPSMAFDSAVENANTLKIVSGSGTEDDPYIFVLEYVKAPVISPKTVEPENPVETEKTVPMYRLFNKGTLEHLYTDSMRERDVLSGSGWIYEGIAWYAPEKSKTPVYRLYNPILKDHHYTTDTHERDVLSSKHGWIYEGIGWYSDDSKTVPIYRRFYPFIISGSHHYTNSLNEATHLVKVGWINEGIGWYGAAEK